MPTTLTTTVDDAGTRELWPAYDAVLVDQPDLPTWRAAVWAGTRRATGSRPARAYDGPRLVGFAYGRVCLID